MPVWFYQDTSFLMFMTGRTRGPRRRFEALSLFSSAGIGDVGLRAAGFDFKVHNEIDSKRAALCQLNFPRSRVVVGDIRKELPKIVDTYRATKSERLWLLSAAPPCQGMSAGNHYNGSSHLEDKPSNDPRNYLSLCLGDVARELAPAIMLVENVPGILRKLITDPSTGRVVAVATALTERLPGYWLSHRTIQFADHGVPQRRVRTILLFLREDTFQRTETVEALLWPEPTHSRKDPGPDRRPWPRARDTLLGYHVLDGRSRHSSRDATDELHFVPSYTPERYKWIELIPRHSGKSAFELRRCTSCRFDDVPLDRATCSACGKVMEGRPTVKSRNGRRRLIIGHHTSYRRMPSDLPVTTITTNSNHFGSDSKLHPWQNRVLSLREVADHQTIPRNFQFHNGVDKFESEVARIAVGEAIPPWFMYQLGLSLRRLIKTVSD